MPPIGPKGEKRPADVIAQAVAIGRIVTRETEEVYVNVGMSAGGKKGGKARAASMSRKRRSEIAKVAAKARWGAD